MNNKIYDGNKLELLEKDTWDKLTSATKEKNLKEMNLLSAYLSDIDNIKNVLQDVQNKYETVLKFVSSEPVKQAKILISEGAIKQSYFSLGQLLKDPILEKLIPNTDNELNIKSPVCEFKSLYNSKTNRLRDRSNIKRLYEELNISPNDYLIFKEVKKNSEYEICKEE